MFQIESCKGTAYYHEKTKRLIEFIPQNSIAVIKHKDIDRVSAERLLAKKVKAVINCETSFSGEYQSLGTKMLVEAQVLVVDLHAPEAFLKLFQNGDMIDLASNQINLYKRIKPITFEVKRTYSIDSLYKEEQLLQAQGIIDKSTVDFIDNTLFYAQNEKALLEKKVELPPAVRSLNNRYAVIVTRGYRAEKELAIIQDMIKHINPFIIGVDGGADIALAEGIQPDLIFGDMDSVSTDALHSGAPLVVHAYTNMQSPGAAIIKQEKLDFQTFPCFGTSEDAAILMAFYAGAKKIISVGSHKSILDYQEKNRQGMGSTLLTRLLVGEKLIDVKDYAELADLKAEMKHSVPVITSLNRTFKRTWAQVLENGPY